MAPQSGFMVDPQKLVTFCNMLKTVTIPGFIPKWFFINLDQFAPNFGQNVPGFAAGRALSDDFNVKMDTFVGDIGRIVHALNTLVSNVEANSQAYVDAHTKDLHSAYNIMEQKLNKTWINSEKLAGS